MVGRREPGTGNTEPGARKPVWPLFPVPGSWFLIVFASILWLAAVACGGGGDKAVTVASTRPPAAANASTGPSAELDKDHGPPGTDLRLTGKGWPALAQVTVSNAANVFATVTTTSAGSFCAHFRLDKTPGGSDLKTGRMDLVVSVAKESVSLPFQVESIRPVAGRAPGCTEASSGG